MCWTELQGKLEHLSALQRCAALSTAGGSSSTCSACPEGAPPNCSVTTPGDGESLSEVASSVWESARAPVQESARISYHTLSGAQLPQEAALQDERALSADLCSSSLASARPGSTVSGEELANECLALRALLRDRTLSFERAQRAWSEERECLQAKVREAEAQKRVPSGLGSHHVAIHGGLTEATKIVTPPVGTQRDFDHLLGNVRTALEAMDFERGAVDAPSSTAIVDNGDRSVWSDEVLSLAASGSLAWPPTSGELSDSAPTCLNMHV